MCHIKSLLIRQRGESQIGCYKKTKRDKFSERRTFLTPWYAYVCVHIRGKECLFFGKFSVLCFAYFVHFAHRHLTFNSVFNFPTLLWNVIAGWVKVLRDLISRWLANSIFCSHDWIYHQISTQGCLKHFQNVSVVVKFNLKRVIWNMLKTWKLMSRYSQAVDVYLAKAYN